MSKSTWAKFISLLLVLTLCATSAFAANPSHIIPYTGVYDAAAYPQAAVTAVFTSDAIAVDGMMDEAYAAAAPAAVAHVKNALTDDQPAATGSVSALWDGSVLYLLVDVQDATLQLTPVEEEAMGANPAIPGTVDSVTIGIDLYNDKVVYETDTIGTFVVDACGALHYYRNGNIPSLGSVMGDPIHPEYQNRIKAYAAQVTESGYTVEAAIQIENLDIANGYVLGLEVQINDVASPEQVAMTEEEIAAIPEGGEAPVARLVGNTFLSHDQDALYARLNDSSPNCVDWANLTLDGWDGQTAFAVSTWRLSNAIRYLDSISFPKDVYTAESQAVLDDARAAAEALLDSTDAAAILPAADALEAAIAGLRWADTRYPDPDEFADQMTLPNPYQFFQSDRVVTSNEDWAERRAEILDLAQFYEYGYKPAAPEKIEVTGIEHFNAGDTRTILFWGFWPMDVQVSCPTDVVTIAVTDHDVTASLTFTVYLPTDEQLAAAGHTKGNVPVVLSFDGDNEAYRAAGQAVVEVPAGSGGDGRSNEYAWGTRTGAFYELYPYSRNGEGALKEVSSEMAAAWSASRVIDALEHIGESTIEYADEIAETIDPSKLAVTGFSINGKYAFVTGVFDERIGVTIPGASGASGLSPWRYVYTGHVYDWTDTAFAPAEGAVSSPVQVAFGTEVMANSVRHNRVRETELFRQFMTPGNFYKRLEGAYGFGTRLPYDQNDLIATIAPRAVVLVNTVNDCNDGCEADALGMEVAKAVYTTLGYDADALLKFNYRGVQDGEPHGNDAIQYARNAAFINEYFLGEAMEADTAAWMNIDPFMLPISEGASPFDTYYGGFNTITGGDENTAGWYSYRFAE